MIFDLYSPEVEFGIYLPKVEDGFNSTSSCFLLRIVLTKVDMIESLFLFLHPTPVNEDLG